MKPVIKIVAMIVACSFLAQDVAWAYPDVYEMRPSAGADKLAPSSGIKDGAIVAEAYVAQIDRLLTRRIERTLGPGENIFSLDNVEIALVTFRRENPSFFENGKIQYKRYGEELVIAFSPGYLIRYFTLSEDRSNMKLYRNLAQIGDTVCMSAGNSLYKQIYKLPPNPDRAQSKPGTDLARRAHALKKRGSFRDAFIKPVKLVALGAISILLFGASGMYLGNFDDAVFLLIMTAFISLGALMIAEETTGNKRLRRIDHAIARLELLCGRLEGLIKHKDPGAQISKVSIDEAIADIGHISAILTIVRKNKHAQAQLISSGIDYRLLMALRDLFDSFRQEAPVDDTAACLIENAASAFMLIVSERNERAYTMQTICEIIGETNLSLSCRDIAADILISYIKFQKNLTAFDEDTRKSRFYGVVAGYAKRIEAMRNTANAKPIDRILCFLAKEAASLSIPFKQPVAAVTSQNKSSPNDSADTIFHEDNGGKTMSVPIFHKLLGIFAGGGPFAVIAALLIHDPSLFELWPFIIIFVPAWLDVSSKIWVKIKKPGPEIETRESYLSQNSVAFQKYGVTHLVHLVPAWRIFLGLAVGLLLAGALYYEFVILNTGTVFSSASYAVVIGGILGQNIDIFFLNSGRGATDWLVLPTRRKGVMCTTNFADIVLTFGIAMNLVALITDSGMWPWAAAMVLGMILIKRYFILSVITNQDTDEEVERKARIELLCRRLESLRGLYYYEQGGRRYSDNVKIFEDTARELNTLIRRTPDMPRRNQPMLDRIAHLRSMSAEERKAEILKGASVMLASSGGKENYKEDREIGDYCDILNGTKIIEEIVGLRYKLIENGILKKGEKLRLLDIGCGIGNFLSELAVNKRLKEEGVELELYGLGLLEREEWKTHPGITFKAGHAETMPSDWTGKFHYAVSVETMRYSPDKLKFLEEAHRVLAPGGIARINVNLHTAGENAPYWGSLFGRMNLAGGYKLYSAVYGEPLLTIEKGSNDPLLLFPYDLIRQSVYAPLATSNRHRKDDMATALRQTSANGGDAEELEVGRVEIRRFKDLGETQIADERLVSLIDEYGKVFFKRYEDMSEVVRGWREGYTDICLVLYHDGEPIGMYDYVMFGDVAESGGLYVKQSKRGVEAGGELLRAVVSDAVRRKIRLFNIHPSDNVVIQKLHRKFLEKYRYAASISGDESGIINNISIDLDKVRRAERRGSPHIDVGRCAQLASEPFRLDYYGKAAEDAFIRYCDEIFRSDEARPVGPEEINLLVDTFVSRWRHMWYPAVRGYGKGDLFILEGLGDAWPDTLAPFYLTAWGKIASWTNSHRLAIERDEWDAIASRAFVSLLETHIDVSSENAAFFDFFSGPNGIEEIWSIPTRFNEVHVAGHGNDYFFRKGASISNYALRGTVAGSLGSTDDKAYVRIDPPADAEAYLKRKLAKEELTAADRANYEQLVVDDVIRLVDILIESGNANPEKKLILVDETRQMFARHGGKLEEDLTLGDVCSLPASWLKERFGVLASVVATDAATLSEKADSGEAYAIRNIVVEEEPAMGHGLHMGMAVLLAAAAEKFSDTTILIKNPKWLKEAAACDVLSLVMLGIGKGQKVDVETSGPRAREAAEFMRDILTRGARDQGPVTRENQKNPDNGIEIRKFAENGSGDTHPLLIARGGRIVDRNGVAMPVPNIYDSELLRDKIVAKRNWARGLKPSQVLMRVCEVSEIVDRGEADAIAVSLCQWFKYRNPEIAHHEFVKELYRNIRLGYYGKRWHEVSIPGKRIYFAISAPDINGFRHPQVEAIVEVMDHSDGTWVTCWEKHPGNRKGKYSRFIGVGRQLLFFAINKELSKGVDGLIFDLAAEKELAADGLFADVFTHREDLKEIVRLRGEKTLDVILEDVKQGDQEAIKILKKLTASPARRKRNAGTVRKGDAPRQASENGEGDEELDIASESGVLRGQGPVTRGQGEESITVKVMIPVSSVDEGNVGDAKKPAREDGAALKRPSSESARINVWELEAGDTINLGGKQFEIFRRDFDHGGKWIRLVKEIGIPRQYVIKNDGNSVEEELCVSLRHPCHAKIAAIFEEEGVYLVEDYGIETFRKHIYDSAAEGVDLQKWLVARVNELIWLYESIDEMHKKGLSHADLEGNEYHILYSAGMPRIVDYNRAVTAPERQTNDLGGLVEHALCIVDAAKKNYSQEDEMLIRLEREIAVIAGTAYDKGYLSAGETIERLADYLKMIGARRSPAVAQNGVEELLIKKAEAGEVMKAPSLEAPHLALFERIVHRAAESLAKSGIKVEAALVGGMRYLRSARRKDADIALVIKDDSADLKQANAAFMTALIDEFHQHGIIASVGTSASSKYSHIILELPEGRKKVDIYCYRSWKDRARMLLSGFRSVSKIINPATYLQQEYYCGDPDIFRRALDDFGRQDDVSFLAARASRLDALRKILVNTPEDSLLSRITERTKHPIVPSHVSAYSENGEGDINPTFGGGGWQWVNGELMEFDDRFGVWLTGDYGSGKSALAIKMLEDSGRWRGVSCGGSYLKRIAQFGKRYVVGSRMSGSGIIYSRLLGKRKVAMSKYPVVDIACVVSLDDGQDDLVKDILSQNPDIVWVNLKNVDVTCDWKRAIGIIESAVLSGPDKDTQTYRTNKTACGLKEGIHMAPSRALADKIVDIYLATGIRCTLEAGGKDALGGFDLIDNMLSCIRKGLMFDQIGENLKNRFTAHYGDNVANAFDSRDEAKLISLFKNDFALSMFYLCIANGVEYCVSASGAYPIDMLKEFAYYVRGVSLNVGLLEPAMLEKDPVGTRNIRHHFYMRLQSLLDRARTSRRLATGAMSASGKEEKGTGYFFDGQKVGEKSSLSPLNELKDALAAGVNELAPAETITESMSDKGLILFADDVLRRGALIDLKQTLTTTDKLNGATMIIYERERGSGQLLKEIIDESDRSVRTIVIDEVALRSTYGKDDIYVNEASAIECLIRFAQAQGVRNGSLLGVVKGQRQDSDIATDASVNRVLVEYRTPVVSFESDSGVYSFNEALNLLIFVKKAYESSEKVIEWYRRLPPVGRADIQKLYERYIALLEPAMSA